MAPATALKAKAMLKERCPDLATGLYSTSASAIQNAEFVGMLSYWNGFEIEVENAFMAIDWRAYGATLSYRPKGDPGDAHLSHEHVVCGDEAGVQGRFQSNMSQVISAVFKATKNPITFGDYKASKRAIALGDKVPDVTCFSTRDGALRVVGEIKVPWVKAHDLETALEDERHLRGILGQIAEYMYSTSLIYGFLSTYNETIFLKQEPTASGWVLYYSRTISHSTKSEPGTPSLRQCLWYMALRAEARHEANNTTPKAQWVRRW